MIFVNKEGNDKMGFGFFWFFFKTFFFLTFHLEEKKTENKFLD